MLLCSCNGEAGKLINYNRIKKWNSSFSEDTQMVVATIVHQDPWPSWFRVRGGICTDSYNL